MGERALKLINPGDLVKWYEVYGDVHITKDWGYGIVVKKSIANYGFSSGPVTSYRVYREKYQDIMFFEEHCIEKNLIIKGDKNEKRKTI